MKSTFLLSTIAAIACLTGCVTGGSGGVTPNTGGSEKSVSPYTIVNGKIVTPARVDTTYDCDGDSPVTYLDTVAADSLAYELTGNSLKFSDRHLDTLASGTVSQTALTLERVGSGTGLEGTWNYRIYKSLIVSGTPTAADLDTLARRDSIINKLIGDEIVQVRFSNGLIYTYVDINTAEAFLQEWNGTSDGGSPQFADSARYDVAVRVISRYVVELKGLKSAETITLTLDNDGSRTYSSNLAGHAEFHFVANTKTCPNNPAPVWFSEFLLANPKRTPGKAKRGATVEISAKTGIPGFFRRFPLKAPYSLLN